MRGRRRKPRYTGDCFQAAVRVAEELGHDEALVCHGTVTGRGPIEGIPHAHAWVELGDFVFDWSNGSHFIGPRVLYYALGSCRDVRRYAPAEVRRMLLEHEHFGPWEEGKAGEDPGQMLLDPAGFRAEVGP